MAEEPYKGSALAGLTVRPAVPKYDGFISPKQSSLYLVKEDELANNVLYFFFDRQKYNLTVHVEDNIVSATADVGKYKEIGCTPNDTTVIGSIYYGTEINFTVNPEDGFSYSFSGDTDSEKFIMPGHDAEIWIHSKESEYVFRLNPNGGIFYYTEDANGQIKTKDSSDKSTLSDMMFVHRYNDDWTLPWVDSDNKTKSNGNNGIKNQSTSLMYRDGYIFEGWTDVAPSKDVYNNYDTMPLEAFKEYVTSKGGHFYNDVAEVSTKDYSEDNVSTKGIKNKGEIRLYAVWCPVNYVVRYHSATVAEDGNIDGTGYTYIDTNNGSFYIDNFKTGTYSTVTMPTNAENEALGQAVKKAFKMGEADDFSYFRIRIPSSGAIKEEDDSFWDDPKKVEKNLKKSGLRRIQGYSTLAIGVTTKAADEITDIDNREVIRGTWGCPYGLSSYIDATAYIRNKDGKYIDVGVVDVYTDYTNAIRVTWDGNAKYGGTTYTKTDLCHYGESVAMPNDEFQKKANNTLEGWDIDREAIFTRKPDGTHKKDSNGNDIRDVKNLAHKVADGKISYDTILSETNSINPIYYAQWSIKEYEIHFYPGQVASKTNNYIGPDGTHTYTNNNYYTQKVSEMTRLIKNRYNDNAESNRFQFMGWIIDGSGGTYGYSAAVKDIPIVVSGYYTFEVAGASGGCDGKTVNHSGDTSTFYEPTACGEGGITTGTIYLKAGDTVHIAAGSSGINNTNLNGGKNASTEYNVSGGGAGGFGKSGSGGAGSVVYSDNEGLIMVAGGGGGSGHLTTGDSGNSSYYVEGKGWYGAGQRTRYKYLQAYDADSSYDSPNDGGNRPWCRHEGGGGGGGYYGGDRKDKDSYGNGNDTGAYGGAGYVNKNVINYRFSQRTAGRVTNWDWSRKDSFRGTGGYYSHDAGRRYTTTGWGVIDYDETTGYYPANGYVKMSEVAIADQEKVLVSDKTESLGLTDAVQLYAKNGVVKLVAKWGKASPMFNLSINNVADDMMKYYDDLGYNLTDYSNGYELYTALDKDIVLPDLSYASDGKTQIHDGFIGWMYTDPVTGNSKVDRTVTIPKGSSGYFEYKALWADHYAASIWGIDHDYNIYGVTNNGYGKPNYNKSDVQFNAGSSNHGVTFGAALGYAEGVTGTGANRKIASNDFDTKYVRHNPSSGKGCVHDDYIKGGWALIKKNIEDKGGSYYSECLDKGCTVPVFFVGNQTVNELGNITDATIMVSGVTQPVLNGGTYDFNGYKVVKTNMYASTGKGDGYTSIKGGEADTSYLTSAQNPVPDDPGHYGATAGGNYYYKAYNESNMPVAMNKIYNALLNPDLKSMIGETPIVYATNSKDDTKAKNESNKEGNMTVVAPSTISGYKSATANEWWLDSVRNTGRTGTITDTRAGDTKKAYQYGTTTGKLFIPSAREIYGDCSKDRGGYAYCTITWAGTKSVYAEPVLDFFDGNQFEKFKGYEFVGNLWNTNTYTSDGGNKDTAKLNSTGGVITRTPGSSNTKARLTNIDSNGGLNTTRYTKGTNGLAPCFRCE